MADEPNQQRSRRALLAAAAGGAAALAATAALPLTAAAADGDPVLLGESNSATSTTSIAGTNGEHAFVANATGTAFGLKGTSTGSAGVYGVSVNTLAGASPADTAYTGVYGWAPAGPNLGAGVWGDSQDAGVLGTGVFGVYGFGGIGVLGEASGPSGIGVIAWGYTSSSPALEVVGKVRFSRSGRKKVAAGKSSVVHSLAGVTASSKVFAVLASNRSSRYVRAVVPASGKFTVYLNSTVSKTTYVSWFVLD